MTDKNGTYRYLGKPRRIIDGMEKVTGHAKYVADLKLYGMAYARPILSPFAHATINDIDKADAEAMEGVIAILTAADLPTAGRTITSRNSAVLAKERVLFVGQPVVLVVAESEAIAADAAERVFIDYEPLPAAVGLLDAIKPDAPTVWPDGLPKDEEDLASLHADVEADEEETNETDKPNNVSSENHFERGDVEAGFAEADIVIERTYTTSAVHQAYMEPHAVVADPDPMGRGVTIYTSTQGQYSVRNEVARLLSLPKSQVKIRPMVFGGGFGAKYGICEPLAAAAALTLKRPVRLFLSRSEDFLSTTPAPATVIELKTGAKQDGTVTAIQARIYIDNGIFSFGHGGIMSMLIGGYYTWPNLKIDTYEVHTHKSQAGAYRAPGAPQATFALESNMDDMATALNLDPLEFRLQNAVEGGDLMGTGQPWPEKIGLKQCLETIREHPMWKNRQPGDGIGLAVGGWPTVMGTAEALCRVEEDGMVSIELGTVDVSGTNTTFQLVAAEALGVDPDNVIVVPNGTGGAYGPGSGGSQVTYTVAGAVETAATDAKQQLIKVAADEFEAAEADIQITDGQAHVVGVPDRVISIGELAQKARSLQGGAGPIVGEGRAAPPERGPGFVAHLIRVTVDADSGQVTPVEYVIVQDVGFALNPLTLTGQLHGGSIQGISFALHEAMVYDGEGQLLSGSFMDYDVPRIDVMPSIETILVENASPHGPFGARGIGEPPITAGAAAVANAIKDATQVRVTDLPVRREALWKQLQ